MQEDQNEKGSSAVVTAMSGAGLPVLQWKGSERIAELFRDAARAAHGKNVKLCSKPVKRKRIRWKAPDQPDLHQAFHRDFRFLKREGMSVSVTRHWKRTADTGEATYMKTVSPFLMPFPCFQRISLRSAKAPTMS